MIKSVLPTIERLVQMPKISVIIPFYDLERYVRPCLDSVFAAFRKAPAGVGFEIVCVDDGSTDGTGAALDAYAARTPSVRVIHKANGGEGSARNAGMEAVADGWITFLDGDDVWLENHLAVAVPAIRRHPDADLVSFGFASFEEGTEPPKPAENEGAERVFDTRASIPDEALLDIGVYPTFYRREFLRGAAFSELPLGADRLFVAQCLARADKVVRNPAVIHGYRLRANSMAHCAWSPRKVTSQCDYAYGSLTALTQSGKRLGREGLAYLASLWMSDVPNRLLRLSPRDRRDAAAHWYDTLGYGAVVRSLPVYELARRALLSVGRVSPTLGMRTAWLFRKCDVI